MFLSLVSLSRSLCSVSLLLQEATYLEYLHLDGFSDEVFAVLSIPIISIQQISILGISANILHLIVFVNAKRVIVMVKRDIAHDSAEVLQMQLRRSLVPIISHRQSVRFLQIKVRKSPQIRFQEPWTNVMQIEN